MGVATDGKGPTVGHRNEKQKSCGEEKFGGERDDESKTSHLSLTFLKFLSFQTTDLIVYFSLSFSGKRLISTREVSYINNCTQSFMLVQITHLISI